MKEKSIPTVKLAKPASIVTKEKLFRIRELRITALGPKGVGIDEFTLGYPILIPNVRLGEIVKARIKFFYPFKKAGATPLKKPGSSIAKESPPVQGFPKHSVGPRSPQKAFPTRSVGPRSPALLTAIEGKAIEGKAQEGPKALEGDRGLMAGLSHKRTKNSAEKHFTFKKAKYAVAQISGPFGDTSVSDSGSRKISAQLTHEVGMPLDRRKKGLLRRSSPFSTHSVGPRSPSREEALLFPTHSVGKAIEGKSNLNFTVGDVLTVKLNSIVVQTESSRIGIANLDVPTILSQGETIAGHPLDRLVDHQVIPHTVCGEKKGFSRGSRLLRKFKIIIPFSTHNSSAGAKAGQEIKIKLTRIKLNYGFAKLLGTGIASETGNLANVSLSNTLGPAKQAAEPRLLVSLGGENDKGRAAMDHNNNPQRQSGYAVNTLFSKGSKITLTLPKFATTYAKHIVIRLTRPSIAFPSITSEMGNLMGVSPVNYGAMRNSKDVFFINNLLGAKFGEKIRVKLTKVGSKFVIGEIIRLSPNSPFTKIARAKKNISEMLANGMHFGEKVIKSRRE